MSNVSRKWVPVVCASLLISLVAGGCSTGEKKPIGARNPPTKPSEVVFYTERPSNYDLLGTVSVEITPDLRWDARGDATKAFEQIRAKAAAMGANGLYFYRTPTEGQMNVTAAYNGQYFEVPTTPTPVRTAWGQAIWVYSK